MNAGGVDKACKSNGPTPCRHWSWCWIGPKPKLQFRQRGQKTRQQCRHWDG